MSSPAAKTRMSLHSSRTTTPSPAKSLKIPQFAMTGNEKEDADRKGKHALLVQMIEHCLQNYDHIVPLFNAFNDLQAKMKDDIGVSFEEKFSRVPSVVKSIDEDWAMEYVAAAGGFALKKVIAAKKSCPDIVWEMLEAHTQLNPMLRCPPCFQVKAIAKAAFDKRAFEFGNPLQQLKTSGFLAQSTVIWKNPVYDFEFKDKVLTKVTHKRTKTTVVVQDSHISPSWKLDFEWSDMRACFVKPPYPSVQVNVLFGKGTGPHEQEQFGMRSKAWQDYCVEVARELGEEKAMKEGSAGAEEKHMAKTALEDMKRAKAKDTMNKARIAAAKVMNDRKAKRQKTFAAE